KNLSSEDRVKTETYLRALNNGGPPLRLLSPLSMLRKMNKEVQICSLPSLLHLLSSENDTHLIISVLASLNRITDVIPESQRSLIQKYAISDNVDIRRFSQNILERMAPGLVK